MIRLVILILMCCEVMADSRFIELTLEPETIYQNDSFVLNIESSGVPVPVDPGDLPFATPIRETTGTRFLVRGGSVLPVDLRRMAFQSTGTGKFDIGPIEIDGVRSNGVTLNIAAPNQEEFTVDKGNVELEVQISHLAPYVHQQVVMDVVLYHRHRLIDLDIQPPVVENAQIKTVMEARRPPPHPDRPEWDRVLWRYLVFPGKDGRLSISPIQVSGTLVTLTQQRDAFSLQEGPWSLDVRGSAVSDEWWLPASRVVADESWSIDLANLNAGDEFERIITVTANGARAEQIPDLNMYDMVGFLITRFPPRRETHFGDNGVTGMAIFRFRLQSISPTPVFLDTIKLPWWDINKDQSEMEILPARRIHVGLPDRDALLQTLGAEVSFATRLSDAIFSWRSLVYGTAATLWILLIIRWVSQNSRWHRGLLVCRNLLRRCRLRWLLWSGQRRSALAYIYARGNTRLLEQEATILAKLREEFFVSKVSPRQTG